MSQSTPLGVGGSKLSSTGDGTYKPKGMSASEYVDSLAGAAVSKARLQADLQTVIQNRNYDKEYRYDMLVYARMKGYL